VAKLRWIWIDKFIEFNSGSDAVAIKNITMAEDYLHDNFPGFPIMPECLMIEAMAQTAGILVGQAGNYKEKVILAKINKAVFYNYARPGDTIKLHARIESIAAEAASTRGKITRENPASPNSAAASETIAEIDLMFSHIDKNIAGKQFPQENFVFTDLFSIVLRASGVPAPVPESNK
jgi:3-hydroxyacyl-[acyl-carrier-protein] dehydratase